MDHLVTKELRQGNIIEVMGKPVTVSEIYDYEVIKVAESEYPVSVVHTLGIPLTPEWLERLGFKKNETKDWAPCYVLDDYNIYFDNGEILMDGDYIPTARIEYVHQFQNLYFLLTGKELEIKETA